MRGNPTLHSTIKRLFALCVVAASLGTIASPVSAHTPSNHLRARKHVKERAMSQVGKPYSYAQESPRRGFDCSGLLYWTFMDHGDSTIARSSSDQWAMRKRKGYKRVWHRSRLQVGDLLFFDTGSGRVGHAGMYIGRKRFVHSSPSRNGVKIDPINDDYWRRTYVGAVRVPSLQGN